MAVVEYRRNALVGIGVANVFCIQLPNGPLSLILKFWIDAAGAMSRANASLYSLEPYGASRRVSGGTIVEATGGEVFINATDVTRPIDIVRRDTGNYYLLGYWPAVSDKPLHSVEVRVNKRGP